MFSANPVQFLGVVQIQVGSTVFALPVQAIAATPDAPNGTVGGLFEEDGQFGIVIDAHSDQSERDRCVRQAVEEATRLIAQRVAS